jgi:superfamily II DNA or RNA helicase
MNKTTLIIKDQVNIRFTDLDPATRRQLNAAVKYFIPSAKHAMSYKLGHWDGATSYCDIAGNSFLNLLPKLLPIVEQNKYEVILDDRRRTIPELTKRVDENYLSHLTWPIGHPAENQPIILRSHQVEIINGMLSTPQGIFLAATGAGKTLCLATLCSIVETYGKTLTIVPNRDLVTQTEEDFKLLGLDVGVYYGGRKEVGHQHTVATWQSFSKLSKKKKDIDFPIETYAEELAAVIVDETHLGKSNEIKTLLTDYLSDVPLRWGLTGTLPKEEIDQVSLLCSIGDVIGQVTAKQLQDTKVLSTCEIKIIETKENNKFTDYHEEYKFATTDKARLNKVSKIINDEIINNGNTLILVNNIETGKQLEQLIPGSKFISGGTKNKDRMAEYLSFKTENEKPLIATFGIAAVGLNIARLFNVVLFEPGKSYVKVIQSIGRGLRMAKDKTHVRIFDICSNMKYSKRHTEQRIAYYKEAEYPFERTKHD